jgi:hypothetical protein
VQPSIPAWWKCRSNSSKFPFYLLQDPDSAHATLNRQQRISKIVTITVDLGLRHALLFFALIAVDFGAFFFLRERVCVLQSIPSTFLVSYAVNSALLTTVIIIELTDLIFRK